MNQVIYSTSVSTTEIAPDVDIFEVPLAVGRTACINIEYIAKSGTGKRISGKPRAVFTNGSGTPVILDSAVDPYLKKDSAGFPDSALEMIAASGKIRIRVTGYSGQGDTNWAAIITYSIV